MIKIAYFKSFGTVPRIHGNGFLQLDLFPGERLHVWGHRDLPRQSTNTAIHNHRFDFISEVIVGRVFNLSYDISYVSDAPTHEMYGARPRDGEDTELVPIGGRVKVFDPGVRLVNAGQKYSMRSAFFHETCTDVPSATIMRKTAVSETSVPRILVPIGKSPDNEFNRNTAMPVVQMWKIIEEVLGQ